MTAKRALAAHHKSKSGQPDGLDVQAALQALFDDHRLAAELHVFQTLTGDTVVECVASRTRPDHTTAYYSAWRVFQAYGAPILGLMLQVIHSVYHECDRDLARDKVEAARIAPEGG